MKILVRLSFLLLISVYAGLAQAEPLFMGLGDVDDLSPFAFPNGLADLSADGSTVLGERSPGGSYRWTLAGGVEYIDIDLPGGEDYSWVSALSEDGSVVVGASSSTESWGWGDYEATRWTSTAVIGLGMHPSGNFGTYAYGVSADGSVVVGGAGNGFGGLEPFRWTSASGMVGLGQLPGASEAIPAWEIVSSARAVSADGSVAVGSGTNASDAKEAFRWTGDGGMVGLGDLPGGIFSSSANDISADSLVIVGSSVSSGGGEAYRSTTSSGMVGLGDLPGGSFSSSAAAVSGDGTVIVGKGYSASGSEPFIWDAVNGMRELDVVLTDLGVDFTGWQLTSVGFISDDARVIAGRGTNPTGGTESWIVMLDESPAPVVESFAAEFSGMNSIWDVESQDFGSTGTLCEFDPDIGPICLDVTTTTPALVDPKGRVTGTASVAMSVTVGGELVSDGSVVGPLKGKLKGKNGETKFRMKFKGEGLATMYGIFAGPPVQLKASSDTKTIVDASGNFTSNASVKVCLRGMGCEKLQTETLQSNLGDGSWMLLLDVDAQGALTGTARAETAMRTIDYLVDSNKDGSKLKLIPASGLGDKIQIKGLPSRLEFGAATDAEIKYKIEGYQGKVLQTFEPFASE